MQRGLGWIHAFYISHHEIIFNCRAPLIVMSGRSDLSLDFGLTNPHNESFHWLIHSSLVLTGRGPPRESPRCPLVPLSLGHLRRH